MTQKRNWRPITTEIVQFKEEGQAVEGTVADVSEFNGGEYGACMKYTLLGEDHQMRSCVLGSAADKMLASQHLSIGDYIRITFKGVKALDGGKRVNLFEILRDEQEPKEKK